MTALKGAPRSTGRASWAVTVWHLGHRNIIRCCDRPFADTNVLSETLIERRSATVVPTISCSSSATFP
ncbi:MAG: hypothetical protein ACR2P2_08030 [Nakamurella sp.]